MVTIEATSGLATGQIECWAGCVEIETSRLGVRRVWLPRWHDRTEAALPSDAIVLTSSGDRKAEAHLRQALMEVAEYFTGARRTFTVPLELSGTGFFRQVWAEVVKVPYGETRSYQEIAEALGRPGASRAVGAANGANPVAPFVCCQRIVGSDGDLTGYGPGLPLKQHLLAMEDAIPRSQEDYTGWVERVAGRLGSERWVLGLRRSRRYCTPLAAPLALRMLPNRFFATEVEAEAAGYSRR